MSIETELRKEYRAITQDLDEKKRRLVALEAMMKEYSIWFWPSPQTLSNMIVECVKDASGHATHDAIHACLVAHSVELPKQKLSVALSKHNALSYNRRTSEWELIQGSRKEVMDLSSHLTHQTAS